ncbi:tetratricopeptide repeat protein [Robertkochia sediminum]|uniref:tetratricopeptide repeat protein n=1 Tax=Robertkochia sediminum TaxID=2785326 RepID=UPI0019328D6F|nr:hypothetical protein [Robertkochia sediminum]MBL7472834.1 hypothetical protein [Robertkochia sediminum]
MKRPMRVFNKLVLVFVLVWFGLATALAQDAELHRADELIAQYEFDKAERLLLELKQSMPGEADIYEKLGDLYGVKKEWKPALEHYLKLLEFDPNNANYHFKVGGIYGMIALSNKLKALGIIDDIKYHFAKAAQLDPAHLEARWALIEFYLELPGIFGGSYKKAYAYAEELHKISAVEGYLSKGYIEDYRDNTKEARKYFDKASRYMNAIPEDYPRENIHYQFGKIASKYGINRPLGRWHLSQYEKRYNPYSRIGLEWIYYHQAMIFKGEALKQQALAFLEKSLRVMPDFEPAIEQKEALESL